MTKSLSLSFGRALTGAWIETRYDPTIAPDALRRALTGAWIETIALFTNGKSASVAPSRARGLKQEISMADMVAEGRALTGAWIETRSRPQLAFTSDGVAPSRARGLKHSRRVGG